MTAKNPFEELESKIEKVENLIITLFDRLQDVSQKNKRTDIIGLKEAEELLHLKQATIYSHTHRRTIPFIKRGGRLYFSRASLEDWIVNGMPEPLVQKQPLFAEYRNRHKR